MAPLLLACIPLILPKLYGRRLTLRNEVCDNFIVIRWAWGFLPMRRQGCSARRLRAVVECVGKWEGCRTLWTAGRRSLWAWVTMVTMVTGRSWSRKCEGESRRETVTQVSRAFDFTTDSIPPDCYAYAILPFFFPLLLLFFLLMALRSQRSGLGFRSLPNTAFMCSLFSFLPFSIRRGLLLHSCSLNFTSPQNASDDPATIWRRL